MEHGPQDADLVRYLDDELTASERASLEAALADDGRLADSLAELREASELFGGLLADSEIPLAPPMPDFAAGRPRRQHRLLVAALVILTGAGLLAVPPVRASLVEGLRSMAAWITGSGASDALYAPTSSAPSGEATVSAAFSGSTFVVQLEQTSPTGILEVARTPGDRLSATASAGTELLFLTGRLVVTAPTSGDSRIRLAVPESVGTVEISTSSGDLHDILLSETVPRVRVDLATLGR